MEIEVTKDGERIDSYLAIELDISRSKIQKLIKQEKILVNGKSVNSSYIVKENDLITVNDELDFSINLEPEDIPLDIVYEDSYLAIINKPSGMVVHPAPGNYTHTLVNALLYHFNNLSNNDIRPGIVHRIDKDTTGLLVVAKDDKTHELLSDMLKKKEIKRTYWAIVDGTIPHQTGTIDAPIGRDTKTRDKMMVTDINGKDAITHFKVLKRFKNNQTLIECNLETGRTHQIRVHMAYIGYPIYNDPVYGKNKKTTPFGQFLHSKKISFVHPITNELIEKEIDLPDEFKEYIDSIDISE